MNVVQPQTASPKVLPEKIHIVRIAMVRGHLDTTEEFLARPVQPKHIKVDFGHRSSINWRSKTIYTRLFVELEAQDEKDKPIGVNAAYAFDFDIMVENLKDYEAKMPDGSKLHGVMGATLMGIIFSTARGMVLERTKGTYLEGVILPVITPRDLLVSQRTA